MDEQTTPAAPQDDATPAVPGAMPAADNGSATPAPAEPSAMPDAGMGEESTPAPAVPAAPEASAEGDPQNPPSDSMGGGQPA